MIIEELVLNVPLVFVDEVTGGAFQVLSWSNLAVEGLPPGVELTLPYTSYTYLVSEAYTDTIANPIIDGNGDTTGVFFTYVFVDAVLETIDEAMLEGGEQSCIELRGDDYPTQRVL